MQSYKKKEKKKSDKHEKKERLRPQSAPPVKQDGQPVKRSPHFPQHFRLPGQDRSVWIFGRSVVLVFSKLENSVTSRDSPT